MATTTETVDASVQEGHRVYIGNLSFKTTEEQIKEHLSAAGPTATAVELPTRFGRPGGFGFAIYEKEADAKTVIEKLNESELDGRTLRLDPARSKEETEQKRAESNAKRDAAKAALKAEKAEKRAAAAAAAGDVTATGDTTAVTDGDGLGDGEKKKKRKPSKKRAPRRRQPGEEGEEGTTTAAEGDATDAAPDAGAEGAEGTEKPKSKPKRKVRKPKEARIDGVEGEEVAEGGEAVEAKPKREKKPRAPRVKRQEPTGQPSKTTIFVANLPFDIDDAGLSAIFTNLSINVKSATVATRKIYNKKLAEKGVARRSLGFGFVDVEDPAQQQEAVEKAEGTLVGDRTITAKIANEMRPIEVEEANEAGLEEKVEAVTSA